MRGDEVVGLDGLTGTPRWSYQRAGASAVAIDVSPDRSTIVLTSEVEPLRDGRDVLLTALHATTGEVRWTEVVAAAPLRTRTKRPAVDQIGRGCARAVSACYWSRSLRSAQAGSAGL